MIAFIPAPVISNRPQPESPTQIDNLGPGMKESRRQFNRDFRRRSKKHQWQPDRIRNPSRSLIIKGPHAILGFPVLQKNRLDVRVAGKNRNEFSATITAEPYNTDGGH